MSPVLFVIVLAYAVYVVWRLAATGGGGPEDANLGEILIAPFVLLIGVVVGVAWGLIDGIVEGSKQPPPRRASPPTLRAAGASREAARSVWQWASRAGS